MTVFLRLLAKELAEIVRTWRLWVLPGLVAFFALSSPVIAELTPALLRTVGEGQAGVTITLPEPSYLDAYVQWVKNLEQLITIALIVSVSGVVAGERASGTAVLVLTKPVSRTSFVIAKFVAQTAFVSLTTITGTAVVWGVTLAVFGDAHPERLFQATGAWLAWAVTLVAVMTLLSSALSSLAAAGAGIGVLFVTSLLSLWGPAVRNSPVGLLRAPDWVLAGDPVSLGLPLLTAALTVAVCVLAAVHVLRRAEL